MIERIENPEEFARLSSDWNLLLRKSQSDCLFLTWEWLYTWWQHLSGRRKLRLLRMSSGNKLVALAPLASTPTGLASLSPFGFLEFLGTGNVGSDYLDFIVRSGEESNALPEIADYLVQEKAFLNLSQLNRRSALAVGLAELCGQRGCDLVEARTNRCPMIRLTGHTWESYLATIGSEHRYNFRRKLKQLNKNFRVHFEPVSVEEQRREALGRLVALHNLRWSSRGGGSNAFCTPGLLSFHEEITRLALQNGWLRLFTLWLDDQPAASLYGFLYNRVFYFYQSGFDPRFATHSVGMIIMGLAIQSAIEEGAEEYDLLHGEEAYKYHWASKARELYRLEIYPSGARGVVGKAWKDAGGKFRRMARNVLPHEMAERLAMAQTEGWRAMYAALTR
jgi:CelD/BcsL family acetyltransferase involved in cellulose biosynthesis